MKALDVSLATLGNVGITDRTVVIFTSDNGGLSAPEWKLKPVTSNILFAKGKAMFTKEVSASLSSSVGRA